jgi:hypothetical protein
VAVTPRRHDQVLVGLAVAGALGVVAYVSAWVVAGGMIDGYSPARDAISETFARGAPAPARTLMTAVLVVTGVLLVAFGWVLERGLPGRGLGAPLAAAVAGVGTLASVAFPCTAGCPGYGTTFTDSAHTVVAGAGYVALMLAPLLAARRVGDHAPRLARASLLLGGVAVVGFVVRNLGVADAWGGLQQRVFNTTADLWYVLVAGWIVLERADAVTPRRSARGQASGS